MCLYVTMYGYTSLASMTASILALHGVTRRQSFSLVTNSCYFCYCFLCIDFIFLICVMISRWYHWQRHSSREESSTPINGTFYWTDIVDINSTLLIIFHVWCYRSLPLMTLIRACSIELISIDLIVSFLFLAFQAFLIFTTLQVIAYTIPEWFTVIKTRY